MPATLAPLRGSLGAFALPPRLSHGPTLLTPPGTMTSIVAWASAQQLDYQDTALTTLATANNDPVGGVWDESGNARHPLQTTDARRPLLQTAGINSHRSLKCVAASIAHLVWGNLAALDFDATDPFTLYLVIQTVALGNNKVLVGKRTGSATFQGWEVQINSAGATLFTLSAGASGQETITTSTAPLANGTPAICSWRNLGTGHGASGGFTAWKNGASWSSTLAAVAPIAGTIKNSASAAFGCRPATTTLAIDCHFAEVIICAAAHSDADLVSNHGWLNAFYGIF